jgi:dTDP-glucose 4,6-dehydratase
VEQLVRPRFGRPADTAADQCIATAASSRPNRFFEDFGVWKDAPVLIGTTKYEPLPDVKNIMITGGAGFM